MKRVLIISPRFAPVNAADEHRVRTSLPYFKEFGWEPTVIAITPETSDSVIDEELAKSVPTDADIRRIQAWPEKRCRFFGFGHLDYRCVIPIYRTGCKILRDCKYDVVYFSTTAFITFVCAPLWQRRFGCKVVFDFQDPWYHGSERGYTAKTAPGGWIKYQLSQKISGFGERYSMKAADHIISVSRGYVEMLSSRYRHLQRDNFTVIPFGVHPADFRIATDSKASITLFNGDDGLIHWVYVGRGGPDIAPVFAGFFRALRRVKARAPELTSRLRIHFVGTNYSPVGRTSKVVEPIAVEEGVADIVAEHSERVPYYEAISLMARSDGVLLFGSVSPDYTASKLLNCLFCGRPVLAFFHKESLVTTIASKFPNIRLATFAADPAEANFQAQASSGVEWLAGNGVTPVAPDLFQPYLSRTLTKAQCQIFDRLVGQ